MTVSNYIYTFLVYEIRALIEETSRMLYTKYMLYLWWCGWIVLLIRCILVCIELVRWRLVDRDWVIFLRWPLAIRAFAGKISITASIYQEWNELLDQ